MISRLFDHSRRFVVMGLISIGVSAGLVGCAATGAPGGRGLFAEKTVPLTTDGDPAMQINTAYQAGEFQTAYDLARQWRRRDPYALDARRWEAQLALDLGRKEESIEAWQAVAALRPKSAKIQHETGLRLQQLGAASAGLLALKSAAQNDPDNLEYLLDLASAYLDMGNDQAAQAVLFEAQKRNAEDPGISVAIARIFEKQGNDRRAAHYYGLALSAAPNQPTLLRQRGRIYYRLGQYDRARADFAACEKAMIDGEHWPAVLEYGYACLKTGDAAGAQRVAARLHDQPALPQQREFLVAVAAMPQPVMARAATPATPRPPSPVIVAQPTSSPTAVKLPKPPPASKPIPKPTPPPTVATVKKTNEPSPLKPIEVPTAGPNETEPAPPAVTDSMVAILYAPGVQRVAHRSKPAKPEVTAVRADGWRSTQSPAAESAPQWKSHAQRKPHAQH